ncbi:pseudaminic acid synthase [Colwellia sp. 6_MG-2023]|jgi:N-acetylneuraminate synthase|uniref:pseudaminic acid synthase n=1 Tax=Colwellia sp. 6_MG-2023 TaxID=3062676 RepID=UPI0026E1D74A|nr:pseudaminic acid synthase [Colwellia sp. 6_MG-2023]MDO6488131.1 pseudaminic acid synthase [Colwellia sp. 6_MG-2023]
MTKKYIEIDGKRIGKDYKPYIIAELSANHNGDINNALKTIEEAAKCGADAIKIQSYTPDTMTIDCDHEDFQVKGGLWDGYSLYKLYEWAHTPFEWHERLFEKAKEVGITLFSTPFDESALELLEELNAPAYKIASFELTDLPLIKRVAQTGKPMIMSTGMANLNEIEEAIITARENGCNDLVVLHCISAYPAPYEQANLATIPDLAKRFNVISGLSDHTLGTVVSVSSVVLGACLIEKHFIIDRNDKGADSEFSIEPHELKRLVEETDAAHKALGVAGYERKPIENASIRFRRSLYFVEDIKSGELITDKHIRRIRPGFGLAPKHFDELIGKRVNQDIERGTATSWEHISNE